MITLESIFKELEGKQNKEIQLIGGKFTVILGMKNGKLYLKVTLTIMSIQIYSHTFGKNGFQISAKRWKNGMIRVFKNLKS